MGHTETYTEFKEICFAFLLDDEAVTNTVWILFYNKAWQIPHAFYPLDIPQATKQNQTSSTEQWSFNYYLEVFIATQEVRLYQMERLDNSEKIDLQSSPKPLSQSRKK